MSYMSTAQIEIENLMLNPESILKCDKCYSYLGFWHTLRCAMFKKKGSTYFVNCKICKHKNPRMKGQFKNNMDSKWKK